MGDALLIVDELVTNAVRHAGGAAEPFAPNHGQPKVSWCALALWALGGDLLISVYDQDNAPPVLREVSFDTEDGRGLQLVAALSEGEWGCTFLPDLSGKLVWATVHFAPPALAGCLVGDGRVRTVGRPQPYGTGPEPAAGASAAADPVATVPAVPAAPAARNPRQWPRSTPRTRSAGPWAISLIKSPLPGSL